MIIKRNDTLIKRNNKIGGWAIFLSIIILAGGFFLNLNNLTGEDPRFFYITLASFVVGFILVQVGLYFVNRYGGRPRMDEKLDAALKGLPGDFTLYHFMTPTAHLLAGPAGIWVLLPHRQRGIVAFTKNRWRVSNGGILQAYMSIFGQEGIGRPDVEAEYEVKAVQKALAKKLGEDAAPNIQPILIFTNESVEVEANDSPIPAVKIKQLKEFMRRRAKEKPISPIELAAVKAALPQ
jgi:hypothetical protein